MDDEYFLVADEDQRKLFQISLRQTDAGNTYSIFPLSMIGNHFAFTLCFG